VKALLCLLLIASAASADPKARAKADALVAEATLLEAVVKDMSIKIGTEEQRGEARLAIEVRYAALRALEAKIATTRDELLPLEALARQQGELGKRITAAFELVANAKDDAERARAKAAFDALKQEQAAIAKRVAVLERRKRDLADEAYAREAFARIEPIVARASARLLEMTNQYTTATDDADRAAAKARLEQLRRDQEEQRKKK
jgi:hypothetical protein